MGAVNEKCLELLDKLRGRGRAARVQPDPLPSDDELIRLARDLAEQFGAADVVTEVDQSTLVDLRDAYNEGRQPGRLDFDAVVRELDKLGVTAHVSDTSGGDATLYAGPRAPWPDQYGDRLPAVSLGPGMYEGPGHSHAYGNTYELGFGPTDGEHGKRVGEEAQPADVAAAIAAAVRDVEDRRARFEGALWKAQEGLWDAIAEQYPEVITGDFGPGETLAIENAVRSAMQVWLSYNRPDEGIAPTREAADEIVGARRAAAVERLTPMAVVVAGMGAFGLGDLLGDMAVEYTRAVLRDHDFSLVGDDAAERALLERTQALIDEAESVTERVEILVDLVGAHRAARELVERAEGKLCHARTDDGEVCGALTEDDEGECGPCAARTTKHSDV